jgi:hypothetical protein
MTSNDSIHNKSQVMRISRSNELLQIKIGNTNVDHLNYLGRVLTRDGYCAREIKKSIANAKEEFNEKNIILNKQATQ